MCWVVRNAMSKSTRWKKQIQWPFKKSWLDWLSGLSASLWTKELPVQFPVRAHAWVAGQVPSGGHVRGNHTLMFLSLSFFYPYPISKNKINKTFKKSINKKKSVYNLLISGSQLHTSTGSLYIVLKTTPPNCKCIKVYSPLITVGQMLGNI